MTEAVPTVVVDEVVAVCERVVYIGHNAGPAAELSVQLAVNTSPPLILKTCFPNVPKIFNIMQRG